MTMLNWLRPGSTIGIIGGGSVSRLLALSAKRLGYKVGIIDPDPNCLARSISDWHWQADMSNEQAFMDLSMKCDSIIYETENFPSRFVNLMQRAVPVPQGEELLLASQDKMLQKAYLESVRVNIAPFATIINIEDIEEAVKSIGFPCVLKANNTDERFKKHKVLHSEEDIPKASDLLSQGTCVLEAWIPFDKELCIALVKDKHGQIRHFPVTEMTYRQDEFYRSVVPARVNSELEKEVERIGRVIAEGLDFVGVMAVEVFATESEALYVNEIVAHPHRAYHYTFDSFPVSQYDTHIKAITGWPITIDYDVTDAIVMYSLTKADVEQAYTQAQIKPDWHFTFYENNLETQTNEVGHVAIQTNDIKKTLASLKESFKK